METVSLVILSLDLIEIELFQKNNTNMNFQIEYKSTEGGKLFSSIVPSNASSWKPDFYFVYLKEHDEEASGNLTLNFVEKNENLLSLEVPISLLISSKRFDYEGEISEIANFQLHFTSQSFIYPEFKSYLLNNG